jgi:hypothetical protein
MSHAASATLSVSTGGSFNLFGGVARFFETFGAARRCAAAITVDRRPAERDLAVLGLKGLDFTNLPR